MRKSRFSLDIEKWWEDPKFRRSYIAQTLRLQGATRWQIWKYLKTSRRRT